MVEYTLSCRKTKRGAHTTMRVHGQAPEKFGESGSGRHWREKLDVPIGGTVAVKDVSNSGKHDCRILQNDGDVASMVFVATPPARACADSDCPVCGPELEREPDDLFGEVT